MIGPVSPVNIACAEDPFESIVRAMGGVVSFEQIAIATDIDAIRSQPRQEKAVASQPGEIIPENIVAGLENDQESCTIRSQMGTA